MKKLLSIILVAIMLVTIFVIPTTATEFDDSKFKFFEKTVQYYGEKYREDIKMCGYDELYYHYSDESSEEIDWALLYSCVWAQPSEIKYGTVVGGRVISVTGGGSIGFFEGHGVYIKETDSIIPLSQSNLERIIELCPDFVKDIEENKIGQAFGDVNNDNDVNVIDATWIQRHLVGYYDELSYYDCVVLDGGRIVEGRDSYVCISDFDRDGETTVMDATAIQKKLAQIEE